MNMHSYICCQKVIDFKDIEKIVNFYRFIFEPSRVKILSLLKENPHCVCEIMKHLNFSQSLVSHHLADLKINELVYSKREGQKIYYFLSKKGEKIINLLYQLKKI